MNKHVFTEIILDLLTVVEYYARDPEWTIGIN